MTTRLIVGDRHRLRLTSFDQLLPQPSPPEPIIYDPALVGTSFKVQSLPLPFSSSGTDMLIMPIGAFEPADLVLNIVTNSRSIAEPIQEPNGWNRIAMGGGNSGTGGSRTDVFWRRMLEDEPASVTFAGLLTLTGVQTTWAARQYIWRNTDPSKVPVAAGLLPGASLLRTLNGPALTTGWGAVRTGWMQYIGLDRQNDLVGGAAVQAFPVGYLDPQTNTTALVAPHSSQNGCAQGSCYKTEVAASQAASSWTFLSGVAGSIAPAFMTAIAVGGN